jgi:hypothetical protein
MVNEMTTMQAPLKYEMNQLIQIVESTVDSIDQLTQQHLLCLDRIIDSTVNFGTQFSLASWNDAANFLTQNMNTMSEHYLNITEIMLECNADTEIQTMNQMSAGELSLQTYVY